jgi:DNA polymerase (family X)
MNFLTTIFKSIQKMTNKAIANIFSDLADIMELHEENPFKIRSYQNAYLTLRKLDTPLAEMTDPAIAEIKGVGKAIGEKIRELLNTGELQTLQKYKATTPEGICKLLEVNGLGPKKIRQLWKELGAESVGELLYACNENRLIELKGFGKKTQDDIRKKLDFFQRSQHFFLYASVEADVLILEQQLMTIFSDAKIEIVGEMRRKNTTISKIEILIATKNDVFSILKTQNCDITEIKPNIYLLNVSEILPVYIYVCAPEDFGSKLFRYTGSNEFLADWLQKFPNIDFQHLSDEKMVFERANLSFLPPELREKGALAQPFSTKQLIEKRDIKGILHTHTTYSDGLHTLLEMATAAQQNGYEYIGITDHSKAAFYANGLKEDRLLAQWAEIDALNQKFAPFRIFKGIECDILNDGALDYSDEMLQQFDFIIASIHSNLRMDKEKATARLIRAIENPYTTMLGHPTGRLLLAREGYPIDHQKVIDACAANNVAIELNANPYRLDIDWTHIPYAMQRGVKISINPDAHSQQGMNDTRYGVFAARKGGLTAEMCVNTLNLQAFEEFLDTVKY